MRIAVDRNSVFQTFSLGPVFFQTFSLAHPLQHKGYLRVRHGAENVIDIQFRLL